MTTFALIFENTIPHMKFRTPVELLEPEEKIRHTDRMMLLGSCFATNMGARLQAAKFQCDVNPFGALYNPLSVAEAIREVMAGKTYGPDDVFQTDGLWHSYMHHGNFSSVSRDMCLEGINVRLRRASAELPRLDWLIVTWGTAWAYTLRSGGIVVGNCHKQPDKLFERRLITVDEITKTYVRLLEELRRLNPSLKLLFTVSPIRHAKDGFHGNQVSKATLLLAVHGLRQGCTGCHYFPSYEIMMDELRDYRFYADDMLHLSAMAEDYLWERFSACWFDSNTCRLLKEWETVSRSLRHCPMNPRSEAYHRFLQQTLAEVERLQGKYPHLDFREERTICLQRLAEASQL